MVKMELKTLMNLVLTEYLQNDYYAMWELQQLKFYVGDRLEVNDELKEIFSNMQNISDIAEVGLINTEVSELLESIRKDLSIDEKGKECADIAIRLFNFCNRKGIDLEHYILKKHEINMGRESLHGKKV